MTTSPVARSRVPARMLSRSCCSGRRLIADGWRRGPHLLITAILIGFCGLVRTPILLGQESAGLKIFISVDMEGIGGIGTSEMTRAGGKDYAIGRRLMTDEINVIVEALFEQGVSSILVNDSHGDMRNLYHTELDPRVTYIQGNIKPLGMVQGLDASFDGAIFVGYHARAGTPDAFLAHTGSGAIKGLWLNGVEVGEGGANAAFAGALGVPVLMASGDLAFTRQIRERVTAVTVPTKEAVGAESCLLYHPDVVRQRLREGVSEALRRRSEFRPVATQEPIEIRMRFATTTRADVLQAIPAMRRVDGYTVAYTARSVQEAYPLIRLMYKYVRVN